MQNFPLSFNYTSSSTSSLPTREYMYDSASTSSESFQSTLDNATDNNSSTNNSTANDYADDYADDYTDDYTDETSTNESTNNESSNESTDHESPSESTDSANTNDKPADKPTNESAEDKPAEKVASNADSTKDADNTKDAEKNASSTVENKAQNQTGKNAKDTDGLATKISQLDIDTVNKTLANLLKNAGLQDSDIKNILANSLNKDGKKLPISKDGEKILEKLLGKSSADQKETLQAVLDKMGIPKEDQKDIFAKFEEATADLKDAKTTALTGKENLDQKSDSKDQKNDSKEQKNENSFAKNNNEQNVLSKQTETQKESQSYVEKLNVDAAEAGLSAKVFSGLQPVPVGENAKLTSPKFAAQNLPQIEQSILKNLGQGRQQLTLQLNPLDLGMMSVVLQSKDKEVQAVIKTDNQQTQQLLLENVELLQKNLEAQGVKVTKIDIQYANSETGKHDLDNFSQHNEQKEQMEQARTLARFRTMREQGETITDWAMDAPQLKEHSNLHIVA